MDVDESARLRARIEELELRVKLLEAKVRSLTPPERELADKASPNRRSRPRPRCPGCLLEVPAGRRPDNCVWCGFSFEAVDRAFR